MVKYSFSNWCTIIGNALLLLTFISVTINVCFGNWLWVSLSLILLACNSSKFEAPAGSHSQSKDPVVPVPQVDKK